MAHRIDSRRINHLRAEVAKLHRLHIAQFGDGVSGADDPRVGGHKPVHIRPYLQHIGIQRRGDDRSGIIRTAPAQIGHFARILIRRDKARHQRYARNLTEGLAHQTVGQFRVEDMLVVLLFRLDEQTGVEPLCPVDERSHDDGRQTLAIAYDGRRGLGRKVAYQVNALKDILQFAQQLIHTIEKQLPFLARRNHRINHFDVAVHDFLHLFLVSRIARCRHVRSLYQLVGDASQRRNHYDYLIIYRLNYFLYIQHAVDGTYRRSAEFQYFHTIVR